MYVTNSISIHDYSQSHVPSIGFHVVTSVILGGKSLPHQWGEQKVIKRRRSRWERFADQNIRETGSVQK